ncbi:MAG: aldo/keto reductase [Treponema sp.]|jgi:predicted oxidoreductase|nr:aldo/keto reductase [Treponema sp.]
MRTINLGKSGLQVPVIAVGCWRMHRASRAEAEVFVKSAMDYGANFFDNADVYGGDGLCETIFAQASGMNPSVREKLILQTKCGIRMNAAFDFSREHILESVDASLKRLKTGYIDVLLLHRPDALVEPEEVAEAFETLHASGKVRFFGVSNQKPSQIQLLQKYIKQPIVANQLQLSIAHAGMISQGLLVNTLNEGAADRDGSVLDFCRLNDITIQPWSPFQYGFNQGVFLGSEKFPGLNARLDELAEKYSVSNTTIAMAWLLRHPARFQPITGTMKPERLKDCIRAAGITLSRDEWYAIYLAAGNILP